MDHRFNNAVLSFHSYPDDAEAWNAGVLKLLKDKEYRIVIATMTGGSFQRETQIQDDLSEFLIIKNK
jgi:LmbE family N-acetylglucosaminyl deacetylase